MSYTGARRKTVGNQNERHQSSATAAKSKKHFARDSGGDGRGDKPRISNSDDGRKHSKYNNDDGWSANNRRPSNYTSSDIWGDLPSQPTVPVNAWEKRNSKKNQKFHTDQGKKPVPLVGPNFSWNDEEEYPALESRPPVENVWVKRQEKLEGRKAMEPTNQTEEELMIQKAIELSKREAKEEEERRRLIEEEYELQNVILATNPQLFSDFLTPDELAETNKSVEHETTEYQSNDLTIGLVAKESIWDYPKSVESTQKQDKKEAENITKRNKFQSLAHMKGEVNTPNPWSDNQKFDHITQNESLFSEQTEYQETQDNWPENSVNKNGYDETEENESQYVGGSYDYSSTEPTSTVSLEADGERKTLKVSQPKISKVIDMFGGWGSKNIRNSSLQPSYKQERFESYNNHSSVNSVSDIEEIFQDDWNKTKEMSELDENLQYHSSKHNFSKNEKSQLPLNEGLWNNEYSLNDEQYDNQLEHSLYNIESSIAAPTSSFCKATENSSDTGALYLSKEPVPNDDDIMNNIVQDYANLAVKCTDSSAKEKITVQSKTTDIFNTAATLLTEDNLKLDRTDLHHSNVTEPQNSSMLVSNQTPEREIMYTLNNTTPAKFSTKAPNEIINESWNDSKIAFPSSVKNGINDNLFLPHINGSVQDIHNDHENNSADPTIPPPLNFSCQPNSAMPNLMNPNLITSMNPLMMQQQLLLLNNPFFFQQLHQMEIYYRTLSMPFATPFPSVQTPSFNPLLNNLMGSYLNGEHNSNIKPVPGQNIESNSSIPPSCHTFENENQRIVPPKASDAPTVEFENSWLSDLLSEGAAHMDSYIPPPTMPVTNPEQSHPALNVENKGGMNIAQDILPNVGNKMDMNIAQDSPQNVFGKDTIPCYSDCDRKSLNKESSALKYGRPKVNANVENVHADGAPKPSMPDAAEASGWGNIDDMPKKNYNSWNDEADYWADEKVTPPKSMIRSSIYASRKQATIRQPIRQPRQNSQWS